MRGGIGALGILSVTLLLVVMQGTPQEEAAHPFSGTDRRSAAAILTAASNKANRECKKLFVVVGSSWCKLCPGFVDKLKSAPLASVMDRNYVLVKLDGFEPKDRKEFENDGIMDYISCWNFGNLRNVGVPYYVVLDSNLKALIDCMKDFGSVRASMVGFKGDHGDHFVQVLKRTASRLDRNDVTTIQAWVDEGAPN